jgi:hypothetical protein
MNGGVVDEALEEVLGEVVEGEEEVEEIWAFLNNRTRCTITMLHAKLILKLKVKTKNIC